MNLIHDAPLEAALAYAAMGWHVAPLYWAERFGQTDGGAPRYRCACGNPACHSPAKHPIGQLVPSGIKQATTDEALIRQWWGRYPLANVAVATGEASGLVVVDIDPKNGGEATFGELAGRVPALLETLTVRTGSGGGHLYFAYPGFEVRNSVGSVGQGIDVRGTGGYVVAPPSRHASGGTYEWVQQGRAAPLPMLPGLTSTPGLDGRSASGAPRVVGEVIPKGEQHHTLVSLAGSMRHRGMIAGEIMGALREVNKRLEDPTTEAALQAIADWAGTKEPGEVLGYRAEDLAREKAQSPATPLADMLADAMQHILSVRGTGGVPGIPTGLAQYDRLTGGMMPAEMTVLGARPSHGKSTLAFQIMLEAARMDVPVLLFSAEMSNRMVSQRVLANAAGVDSLAMRLGTLPDEDYEKLARAQAALSSLPVYSCDTGGLTIEQATRVADRMRDERGDFGLIVADYLQLIRSSDKTARRDDEVVAATSVGLKTLAKRHNCHVLALAQLNRGVETRAGDKTPTLADLRQSGQIEQDADVACFLHRPIRHGERAVEVSGMATSSEHYACLSVAKQRNGPLGACDLHFDGALARFEDWDNLRHRASPGSYSASTDKTPF